MIKTLLFFCITLHSSQASSLYFWRYNIETLYGPKFPRSKEYQDKTQKEYEEKVLGPSFFMSQDARKAVDNISVSVLNTFTPTGKHAEDFKNLQEIVGQKLREHFGKNSSVVRQYSKNPAKFLLAFIVRDAFRGQFLNKEQAKELHKLLNEVCEKKGRELSEAQKKLKEFLEKIFGQLTTPQFIRDHKAFLISLFCSEKIAKLINNKRLDQQWENTEQLLYLKIYETEERFTVLEKKYHHSLAANQLITSVLAQTQVDQAQREKQWHEKYWTLEQIIGELRKENDRKDSTFRNLNHANSSLEEKIRKYEKYFQQIQEIQPEESADLFLSEFTS